MTWHLHTGLESVVSSTEHITYHVQSAGHLEELPSPYLSLLRVLYGGWVGEQQPTTEETR